MWNQGCQDICDTWRTSTLVCVDDKSEQDHSGYPCLLHACEVNVGKEEALNQIHEDEICQNLTVVVCKFVSS